MAYKIRQAKLDLLISYYKQGGTIDKDTIPEILGITTPAAIKEYFKTFNEWQENGDRQDDLPAETENKVEAPVKKTFAVKKATKVKKTEKAVKDYRFVVEDEFGGEEEFEPVTVTSSTVVLRKVEPIVKVVTIKGVGISVDLRELRKLDPDSLQHGVKVSDLITAAELA